MTDAIVHADAAALGAAVARAVVGTAAASIAARGRFRLALPGGASPLPAYDALAAAASVPGGAVDWTRAEVFLADERAVPEDDPASNARAVREGLLVRVGAPPACLRRPRAEDPDLERAASEYAALLAEPLDLVLLGLGEDGHVASLFPGSPLLAERTRAAGAVFDSPKPPPRRLTLLPGALRRARGTLVIARGAAKAEAVRRAFAPAPVPLAVPTAALTRVTWHLDREAAAGL